MRSSHTLLAKRLAAIPVVVTSLLGGIWFTGAVITNDFVMAMVLTAVWMGMAGLISVAIALRSRAFRWPVLGTYLVTAAVVGAYLGSSVLLDNEVNEQVAVAAPAPPTAATSDAARREQPRNVRLRAGRFQSVRHPAGGDATLIDLAEGGRVLTLTDFRVDNGPDLRVYLVAGAATTEGEVSDYIDLGALKGNKGNQQYEIPSRVDTGRYTTAVIWCRAFSVLFARAPLQR